MGQTEIITETAPLSLRLGSALRSSDELYEFCLLNRELRIERTAQGELEIMAPTGGESGARNSEINFALVAWAKQEGRGVTFDSSTGFLLPDGAMRSPDAAWILRSRLEKLPQEHKKGFLPLAPDFVIELRSHSDAVQRLQAKMQEYVDNGVRLAWLIDPEKRRAYTYRPGQPVQHVERPSTLAGDPELPGLVVDLRPIWDGI